MDKNYNIFEKLIQVFPYLFVFLASVHSPTDPDLGWHLKYGEYFFKYGRVLRDNTFSQLMPDYKWANTSWATDLISYFTFHNFGFLGLTILGAVVITLTFYFFSKSAQLSFFEESLIFPLTIYFMHPLNSISFRGQLLSLLFLGILFYLLSIYTQKKKVTYFIPFLFLAWSNIHGEFLLGLFLFLGWTVVRLLNNYFFLKIKLRETLAETKFLGLIFLFSIFFTFLNPFGIEIYKNVLHHAISPDLKLIVEYLPFNDLSTPWWNLIIIATLAFWGIIILFAENKFIKRIPEISLFGVTYALSLFVRRYAWMMFYLSIPFLKPVANFLEPNQKKYKYISGSIIILLITIPVVYFKFPLSRYYNFSWDQYCTYNFCSKGAVEFIIKNNLQKKKLLTMYNWGGWIIWNYPEVKPTIDGRMHLWKDKKGYSAFDEYFAIEQNFTDVDKSKYDAVFISPEKHVYKRLIELVNEGKWKLVYKDNYSGIFIRNVFQK
ncbi:MAG: hypothetical protein A3B44_02440 [Candidatus Levybacteria bacterium RIFCSPLOWO2_01_FULL_38_21]|nr:MAG: hypothetical protein A3B44_02440 [Candidatus Levybacteria bacterium RIFCSPLOWO2_01_FULL_38_21]